MHTVHRFIVHPLNLIEFLSVLQKGLAREDETLQYIINMGQVKNCEEVWEEQQKKQRHESLVRDGLSPSPIIIPSLVITTTRSWAFQSCLFVVLLSASFKSLELALNNIHIFTFVSLFSEISAMATYLQCLILGLVIIANCHGKGTIVITLHWKTEGGWR